MTEQELAQLLADSTWEAIDVEHSKVLNSVLRNEMPPGHLLEPFIDQIEFVAVDNATDDRLLVIRGSNVFAYGVHMSFTGERSQYVGFPFVEECGTFAKARNFVLKSWVND
jgi:hypothetical protein